MTKFLSHLIILFIIVGATATDPVLVGGGTPNPPKTEGADAVHGSGTGVIAPNSTGAKSER